MYAACTTIKDPKKTALAIQAALAKIHGEALVENLQEVSEKESTTLEEISAHVGEVEASNLNVERNEEKLEGESVKVRQDGTPETVVSSVPTSCEDRDEQSIQSNGSHVNASNEIAKENETKDQVVNATKTKEGDDTPNENSN